MAKYFPQHFKRTRGYHKAVTEQIVGQRKNGAMYLDLIGTASKLVAFDYVAKVYGEKGTTDKVVLLKGFQELVSSGMLFSEGMGAMNHGDFELSGSVVFDVNPSLVSELKDSDADEISISDVEPPFPAFYLHVGPQSDIVFNGSVVFEGAYIRCSGGDWSITICGRRPGNWWDDPADWHTLRLTAETFDLPLPLAIDRALEIDRDDLIKRQSESNRQSAVSDEYVSSVLVKNDASARAMKAALNLCVQILAYIANYRDDQKKEWQEGTPEKMREKADAAPSVKERDRNESKLRSMGYWKVIKVGFEFGRAHLEAARAGERTPHSRRAHWRRQRYGQGFALSKLIYIQRTFVMGSAAKRMVE